MVVREEMVASGVNFLRHPRVQSAPLSQRVTFLEKKGLTQEEIAEALARKDGIRGGSGAGQAGGGSLDDLYGEPPAGLMASPLPPHVEEGGGSGGWASPSVLVPTSLAAGLGLGVAAMQAFRNLWHEPPPFHPGRGMGGPGQAAAPLPTGGDPQQQLLQEEEEMAQDAVQGTASGAPPADPLTELARAIERQAQALSELAQASERSRQDLHSFFSTHVASQTLEIRSELSTIKQMLLLGGGGGGAGTIVGTSSSRLTLTSGLVEEGAGNASLAASTTGEGSSSTGGSREAAQEEEEGGTEKRQEEEGQQQDEEARLKKEQEEEEEAAAAARVLAKQSRVRRAVCEMARQNEPGVLGDAADMLSLYLSNLLKYPTVPRFRKVALVNQGYRDRVASVKGHKEFLSSVGYRETSSYFEWDWHSSEAALVQENAGVLRFAMDLLAKAKAGEEDLSAPAHEEEEEKGSQQQQLSSEGGEEGQSPSSPSTAPAAAGGAGSISSGPSTPQRQGPSSSSSPARQASPLPPSSATSPSSSSSSSPGPRPLQPAALAHAPPAPPLPPSSLSPSPSSSAPDPSSSSSSSPVEGDGAAPQYPQSFLQIMEAVKRGETPQGIVTVEDRLSVDAPALLLTASHTSSASSRPGLAKPWEAPGPGSRGSSGGPSSSGVDQHSTVDEEEQPPQEQQAATDSSSSAMGEAPLPPASAQQGAA